MTPSPAARAPETSLDIFADIGFAVGVLLGSKHHVKPEAIDEAIERLERVSAYLKTKFSQSVESDEDAVAQTFADAAPKPSARYVCVLPVPNSQTPSRRAGQGRSGGSEATQVPS